ncbi:hypothetical protein BG32_04960 [Mesotoga sp. HF07.pep.5.2.highcov]|uniref:DUF6577 family protein n=1 Tax=Mesotoga sp. HF07.pep.5.2.highcov TaxID=1462923 RepID=UPI000EF13B8E|nr:DUF6577 family protein [Mesotoga sp. HF07.pep.5.2.highcov]RLL91422.1 hypothetical protein BG32_04960 [Mesotoga sp. HF07.pep.5.2.highcov]
MRNFERDISDLADESGLITRRKLITYLARLFPEDSEQRLDWRINSLKKIGLLSSAGRGIYRIENLAVSDLKIDGMKGSFLRLSDIREPSELTSVSGTAQSLEKMGMISRVAKGIFSTEVKPTYLPSISAELKDLWISLAEEFPYLGLCMTDTYWINSFISQQAAGRRFVIETEKGAEESVFDFLSVGYDSVLLKPSERDMRLYGSGLPELLIVKNLVTQSPITSVDDVPISSLEKILVDVFCDEQVYDYIQGDMTVELFEEAFERFAIDQSVLRRYASRRGRWRRIREFVTDNIGEVWVL